METQQLLLIVLGVIIVGIAIAVGITIFNNQAYNANQQAVASELNNYAAMVMQWWKTPAAQGGAGQLDSNISQTNVATWIGFDASTYAYTNPDTGQFKITAVTDGSGTGESETVEIQGLGNEERNNANPLLTTTVTLASGDINTVVSSDTEFDEDE